jgi:hypothetical protein
MSNWLAAAPEDRPALETRESGGALHARCPMCGVLRPAFAIVKLSTAAATAKGGDWACDGDLSKWEREGLSIADAIE